MVVKYYELFNSAQKTATKNNLVIAENNLSSGKVLFDFSALDSMIISDDEKEVIKEDALKNVCAFSKESFYGAEFDNFTSCIGHALYYKHAVYSEKSGKRLYVIMQLGKAKHTHSERKSVYDEWNNVTTSYIDGYCEPMYDAEI